MKKLISFLALVVIMASVGWVVGDSTLRWSNPESQNGTFILDNVVVTNSTMTGGNGTASFSNLTVTTAITLPAGSVGADDIAAGTMANQMIVSNANDVLYISNLTVKVLGSVTVPAGSIASASIAAGNMNNLMQISNVNNIVVVSNIAVGTFMEIAGASVKMSALPTTSAGVASGYLYVDLAETTPYLCVKQ